ncbi:hypothetical protein FI667_g11011, partial [Globisporangium splendens]
MAWTLLAVLPRDAGLGFALKSNIVMVTAHCVLAGSSAMPERNLVVIGVNQALVEFKNLAVKLGRRVNRCPRRRFAHQVPAIALGNNTISRENSGDLLVLQRISIRIVVKEECGVSQSLDVYCVQVDWPSVAECELSTASATIDHQVVTILQGNIEYAFGFVSATFPCDEHGSSVYIIASAVPSYGEYDPPSSPGSNSGASGSSDALGSQGPDSAQPPVDDGSDLGSTPSSSSSRSADDSSMPSASSPGSAGDTSSQVIPDELFQATVRYPFVFLSGNANASSKSVAIIHISRSFVIANTQWIQDFSALKWVLFEDDRIEIDEVYFEDNDSENESHQDSRHCGLRA